MKRYQTLVSPSFIPKWKLEQKEWSNHLFDQHLPLFTKKKKINPPVKKSSLSYS